VISQIDHDAIFKELLSTFFLDFLELFVPQVLEYAEPSKFSLEPTETIREIFAPVGQGKKKVADVSIQLNRLNWRDFLRRENPVASALMAKMRMAPSERAQVKAECLRLLATLELNREKMELISGFIGTYLRLDEAEEEEFQQAVERMDLGIKERVMEFATDWQEKGREQGRQEGLEQGLREGKSGSILRTLELRFDDVELELRKLIERIEDLQALDELLVQAVTTQSLEAFASAASQYAAEDGEQSFSDSD
jgi:predicted transposase YdaD